MTRQAEPRIQAMASRKPKSAKSESTPMEPESLSDLPVEALWVKWSKQQEVRVRNELVVRHTTLVRHIAEREVQKLPRSVDVDDLCQEGMNGLMDAITKFNPELGIKFKTYASTRIRGAMMDSLRRQDWQPRNERQRAKSIERTRVELREELRRDPTDEEIARQLSLKPRDVQKMQPRQMHSVSDRRQTASEDGEHTLDALAESRERTPIEHAHRKDLMEELGRVLTPKERAILAMYYLDGLTFRQIGIHLAITESRVCQIHTNMKRRLRQQFEDRQDQFEA